MPITELSIEDVIRKVGEIGIIPVVRASSVEEANRAVEAICAGGIPVVEITMTVPNAISVIRELVQRRGGDVLIGAGTVTNAEQAESCVRAGAQFLVSPGLSHLGLVGRTRQQPAGDSGCVDSDRVDECARSRGSTDQNFSMRKLGRAEISEVAESALPSCSADSDRGSERSQCCRVHCCRGVCAWSRGGPVDAAALREGNLEKITSAARELVQAVAAARPAKAERKAS